MRVGMTFVDERGFVCRPTRFVIKSAPTRDAANELTLAVGKLLQQVERQDALIARLVEKSRSREVEPTWTGTNGRTQRLCDMPTRYLVNITRRYHLRELGIFDAIQRELAARTERDGSLRDSR